MVIRDGGRRGARVRRVVAAGGTASVLAAALAGCGSSGVASSAASSLQSAASGAASQLESKAKDALASASAAASSQLAKVKDGVNAKDAVTLGSTTVDSAGNAKVEVTAKNSDSGSHDFTVNVNFLDSGGKVLDAVVLNIDGVEAGKSRTGTATSNIKAAGATSAEVGAALRH